MIDFFIEWIFPVIVISAASWVVINHFIRKRKSCCPPNQCDCDQDGGDHFQ